MSEEAAQTLTAVPRPVPAARPLTRSEYLADAFINVFGVLFAIGGAIWLLNHIADGRDRISIAVYGAALVLMLLASAAYNTARETYRYKELLRRIDHAMIYVKIAGTYTPFMVGRLHPPAGLIVLCAVWGMAAIGAALKLALPQGNERLSVILYVAMGWTALAVVGPLFASLHHTTFWLLVAGGLTYSLGAPFHLLRSMEFNKVIWHAFVLIATVIQFIAVAGEFAR